MFCLRDNLENNYCISPIFCVKSLINMEMTWLDFQLSTDNQNGRQLATKFLFLTQFFFSTIHSSALKLCINRSSVSANLLVLSVFMCDRKRGYGCHIDFVNLPYAASFGYYANMVQQIEFIIYTNV